MSYYRKHWYYIGGIIFVALAFNMILFGGSISPLRRITIAFFMGLLVHQFEEYALPGGFPVACNRGLFGETTMVDRYPANTNSIFIVNVPCAYTLYILGIIFYNFIPLGIFLAYFGFSQLIVHGFIINKQFKTIYNPGMASIIFIFLPLGIYYLWYVAVHFNLPSWYWWVPLLLLPIISFLIVMLPIQLGKDRNTKCVFPKSEIEPFSVIGKSARNRR